MILSAPPVRARREGVRAERVLVLLKQAWRELPECAQVPRQDANELLGQIVAACIDEYYEVALGRRRGDSVVRGIL